jgi:hypothetical protein
MRGRLLFAPLDNPRVKPAGGAGAFPQSPGRSPDHVRGQEGEGSEERVGKGRPPHSTRFRPGQSGNPSGRSKRARDLAAIAARAFAEKVEVRENGRRRRITKLEASVKQLVNRAAGGDQRATQFAFALLRNDPGSPPPGAPERLGEADAFVVAELVRRLSRPAP